MKFKISLLTLVAAAALAAAPGVHAKTFKWASQGEIATWDIHSQNNALQNGLHANVYESLVYYNSKTFAVGTGVGNVLERNLAHPGALQSAQGSEIQRRYAIHRR